MMVQHESYTWCRFWKTYIWEYCFSNHLNHEGMFNCLRVVLFGTCARRLTAWPYCIITQSYELKKCMNLSGNNILTYLVLIFSAD
jgi:hypothetical protein